jgi:phosphoribosylglycinamide formyltransferase 1
MTLALGVLISGSGTNLAALMDSVAEGRLDARIRVVVSNKPSAYGLERAKKAGLETVVVDHKEFPSRESFDERLVEVLRQRGVEWVALAGFMRVLTPTFLRAYAGRVVNIHPSLLPAFRGTDAQKQALDYGVRVAGCTVHFVSEEVDGGAIIVQRAVEVADDETLESLRARILKEEHIAFPEALELIARGLVRLVKTADGRERVLIQRPLEGAP